MITLIDVIENNCASSYLFTNQHRAGTEHEPDVH